MKKINMKILILGFCLLILAGLTIVLLKGFKVDLMFEQHESIEYVIGKKFDIKEVKQICNEVFGNKNTVIRTVELFDDSVNISVISVTDEEKEKLVEKMNEKFGTSESVDSLTVQTIYNVRLRDMIKPYILPVLVSTVCILIYLFIRFRKKDMVKLLIHLCSIIIVKLAVVLSILAITRFPLSPTVIYLLILIPYITIIIYTNRYDKNFKEDIV